MDIQELMESLKSLQNVDLKNVDAKQYLYRYKAVLVSVLIILVAVVSAKAIYQKGAALKKKAVNQIEESRIAGRVIEKIVETQKELERLRAQLPVGKDFPDVINEVSVFAQTNHVEVASIAQQQGSASQYYYTLPLSLTLKGTYRDIVNFIGDIERSPYFFRFNNATINPDTQSSGQRGAASSLSRMVTMQITAVSLKKE